MPTIYKKILVLLPVILLGLVYFNDHAVLYERTSKNRLLFLAALYAMLYGWIFLECFLRKQSSYLDIAIQSSFFLYVFMILVLTGYFTLFRELASSGWWHKMTVRIESKDHVNLELFKIFTIYRKTDTQIFGNLVMLFPLGIFIPLLYKKLSGFLVTVFFCFFVSVMLECLQLATKYRSADVDDVFLNTFGAAAGAVLFHITQYFLGRTGFKQKPLHEGAKPVA